MNGLGDTSLLYGFDDYARNVAILTDGYKPSHRPQYESGTTRVYSYWESRGGLFPQVVPFGLQGFVKRYLLRPLTHLDVTKAAELYEDYFQERGIFFEEGFRRIVDEFGGYLPLEIKAVPEGFTVPTRNVMLTIENTHDDFYWLTNYLETILSQLWYPSTVCTLSRAFFELIHRYREETGDPAGTAWGLHDFGFRGVSSVESAAIGGAAHLVNFNGTDTVISIPYARCFYGADRNIAGSIPASEHSTMSLWGRSREYEAFANMVKQYGHCKAGLYACVSDTYNIFDACRAWGSEPLRSAVLAAPGMLVVRPDSGTPHVIVVQVAETLAKGFGSTPNGKGFKVLNRVRIIQGDGVNYEEAHRVLEALKMRGWAAENLAFGMGGALLQRMDRDTQRFAVKASWALVNGEPRDIWKDPVTDPGKRSKRGRLKLVIRDGVPETVPGSDPGADILRTVYRNGKLWRDQRFLEIRELSSLGEKAWSLAA